VLTAFSTGLRRLIPILGKIARVVPCSAATVAGLPALATRFRGPFRIIGKIAGTMLSASMTGVRGLFTVLGEVSRISGVSLFRHVRLLFVS
jgi:hypothetical protein